VLRWLKPAAPETRDMRTLLKSAGGFDQNDSCDLHRVLATLSGIGERLADAGANITPPW
jgi:hypothetical protein